MISDGTLKMAGEALIPQTTVGVAWCYGVNTLYPPHGFTN